MIIDLASVGTSPKPLVASFSPAEIDLDNEATLTSDVVLNGEMFSRDGKVHIDAAIFADISLICTRCLEPVAQHLGFRFDDVFVDSEQESRREEAELALEELDEALVIGGEIDLAEVVREQILLALPEQVFCKDDCKGLCPKCGGNRNLIDCSCDREEIDPRWAALKNIN